MAYSVWQLRVLSARYGIRITRYVKGDNHAYFYIQIPIHYL